MGSLESPRDRVRDTQELVDALFDLGMEITIDRTWGVYELAGRRAIVEYLRSYSSEYYSNQDDDHPDSLIEGEDKRDTDHSITSRLGVRSMFLWLECMASYQMDT